MPEPSRPSTGKQWPSRSFAAGRPRLHVAGPLELEDLDGQRSEMLLPDRRIDRFDLVHDCCHDAIVRNVERHDKAEVRGDHRPEVDQAVAQAAAEPGLAGCENSFSRDDRPTPRQFSFDGYRPPLLP